jgi:excisionase family DNA binding protein
MALLTVRGAAERLSVHPDTVRRLLDRGDLPRVRVGRAVRIREDDLESYIRRGGDQPIREPITGPQLRALHAKAAVIDRTLERDSGSAKRAVMAAASTQFGREITSSGDLSSIEADWVLDRLQESVDQLRAR